MTTNRGVFASEALPSLFSGRKLVALGKLARLKDIVPASSEFEEMLENVIKIPASMTVRHRRAFGRGDGTGLRARGADAARGTRRKREERSFSGAHQGAPKTRCLLKALGIEADSGQPEITIEHQSGTMSTDADPADVSDRARKCAIVRGVVTESSEAYELSNVVETALAEALVLAAEAKRWDVVLQITDELQRRGSAQTSITASSARRKRSSRA